MISRTTDIDFIVKCVTASWAALTDDGAPNINLYFPPMGEDTQWYRADDWGVYLLHKQNHVTWEVHTCLLPHARGKAVEIGREALAWVWENTPALRIVTQVPSFNPLALRLAKKCGFEVIGINKKSFQKNGVLYDVTLLGISKGV